MSHVTQEHYRAQNAMHATAGFTFERGVLTAAQAKSKYNLTVPSNYTWYLLMAKFGTSYLTMIIEHSLVLLILLILSSPMVLAGMITWIIQTTLIITSGNATW